MTEISLTKKEEFCNTDAICPCHKALFFFVTDMNPDKLERLSQVFFLTALTDLRVRYWPSPLGASRYSKNLTPDRKKNILATNALAYLAATSVTMKESFVTSPSGCPQR